MKPSSKSSGSKRRSKDDFALRAIFNAMYAVGVTARNVDEAYQAIDLAASLMTYALKRRVTSDEVRARMVQLIEEWQAEAATKH